MKVGLCCLALLSITSAFASGAEFQSGMVLAQSTTKSSTPDPDGLPPGPPPDLLDTPKHSDGMTPGAVAGLAFLVIGVAGFLVKPKRVK